MTDAPIPTLHGPNKWTCDGCGWIDFWGKAWSWFGSYKDYEREAWDRIVVTCSDGCRARLVADGRLPADATAAE